jgi:hypothetical protein
MKEPPTYPRIAHVAWGRGTSDDEVLGHSEANALFSGPVLVEEKLDGANVAVWLDDGGVIQCALRSGLGGQDRSGQLGPLRAWLYQRADALRQLLQTRALYAEWLLTTHSVAYDSLPAYLIGLDLWNGEFAAPGLRDQLLKEAGLSSPPEIRRGLLDPSALETLLSSSRIGSDSMEGLIVRTLDGRPPRIAKLLRPGFERLSDEEWRRGRPHNLLRDRELSWR